MSCELLFFLFLKTKSYYSSFALTNNTFTYYTKLNQSSYNKEKFNAKNGNQKQKKTEY